MAIPDFYHSKTAEATHLLGRQVADSLTDQNTIICLYGELGSGKTTFTQGLAQGLGYTQRLLSPTFLMMRRYDLTGSQHFYHIDLYRLHNLTDIQGLGIGEIFSEEKAIIVVEWPEKIAELLPSKRMDIIFSVPPEGGRLITIKKSV